MPALQCSAVKCMYNKDNLCSKGDIQVKGDHAATENETWCSSFVEKTGMSNAYTCGGGCSSIQVGCAAHDCTYNRQEVCRRIMCTSMEVRPVSVKKPAVERSGVNKAR